MTVTATTVQSTAVSNGVTTVFTYQFRLIQAADLVVQLKDTNGVVHNPLVLNSDYTVDPKGIGLNAGGNITLTVSPANGWTVIMTRVVTLTQDTDLANQGTYLPQSVEEALDELTMAEQQHDFQLQRTIRATVTDVPVNALPAAAQRASQYLAFDTNGQPIALPLVAAAPTLASVASIAALRLISGLSDGANVQLNGYAAEGDGGGGMFFWNASSVATDDGGTIIKATNVTTGRWLRIYIGSPNPRWFGALGDGVTDDTSAINAVSSLSSIWDSVTGTFKTTLSSASLNFRYKGVGRIKDSASNLRAPFFSSVLAAPASIGNENSIETAFNGDISRMQFAVEHRITGAATLTQPVTGYVYEPEAYPHYTYLYNSSGWNQQTGGNDGRTAAVAYRTKIYNAGQGDCVAFNGSGFVTGAKGGATHWLANPAVSLFNGDLTAGSAGVYLNPYETVLNDGGFDVAAISTVSNMNRTNATGALSAIWNGYRGQSIGTATCDALISATGPWVTGLDLAMGSLNFGANKAAISLKADDRLYLNNTAVASGSLGADWRTTAFNKDYITYSSANSFINIVAGNASVLQLGALQVTCPVVFKHSGTQIGVFNAVPVNQTTGWGTPTGNSKISSFNGATATLAQTSAQLAQLLLDLKAYGLLGA